MAEFNLQVGIDSRGARRGGSEVQGALRKIRGGAKNTDERLQRVEKSLLGIGRAGSAIKGTIATLFAGAAARKLSRAADAYTRLGNRISLVTENSTQAAIVQRQLFDIAGRTQQPIEELGTLYGRAAGAADELQASQGELLRFTEGVAQALVVSGSSATQAQGALLQLSQALGSGIVRAEEFNSVLEGARPVLKSVADGLGVTVGQLRSLVVEGEITSREFFDAFLSQLDNIDRQFQTTNRTIGQAGTDINNAFIEAVGTLNEFSGASNLVTSVLGGLADLIRGPLLEGFLRLSVAGGVLLNDFDNLFTAVGDFARQFQQATTISTSNTEAFGRAVIDNLIAPFETLRSTVQIITVELLALFDRTVGKIKGQFAAIVGDENLARRAAEQVERAAEARLTAVNNIFNRGEDRAAEFEDALRGARGSFTAAQIEDTLAALPTTAGGGNGTPPELVDTKELDKLKDQIATFEAANDPLAAYAQSINEIVDLQQRAQAEGITLSTKAVTAAFAEARNELTGYNDLLQEGRDLTESLRTPQEEYNAAIEEFTRLLDAGAINEETFNRARAAAAKTLQDSNESFDVLRDIGRAAAEDIQGAFTDLFLGVANGGEDLADQLGQTLQRITANFLANQAIKALLNFGGSAIGGSFGSALGSFAGEFDRGGQIPSGSFGVVGERGPEIVTGPANVTSRADTAAALAPELSVNVVNVTNPADALDAVGTAAGEKAVVNSIRRNREAVRRELGLA